MDTKVSPTTFKHLLCLLAVLVLVRTFSPLPALAGDLPLAAGSPLAGFAFDDRPLLLPVQRNFQMAMLTASSELGRSCGKMEAYGWRMSASEQQRVNVIFNNTVDRMRGLGYSIEALSPPSLSRDITMFSADRPDKHFLVMWSAGEIGLVMTLCETTPPPQAAHHAMTPTWPSMQTYPQAQAIVKSPLAAPAHETVRAMPSGKFTPVGNWVGNYTCPQGYTGATLQIGGLRNNNFTGTFRFYPTVKNRFAPKGEYTVYGQYDPSSGRILINPGKWIVHPKNVYDTVMVGSFDASARTFSGFFQGVTGCTSFEARYSTTGAPVEKAQHKKAVTKKHVKKAAKMIAPDAAMPTMTPATSGEAPGSIVLPPAVAPVPAVPTEAPAPAASPAAAPLPPTNAPPAPAGTSAPTAPKKSGSLELMMNKIVVASGEYINPIAPSAQPPVMVPPPVVAPQASILSPTSPPAPYPAPAAVPQQVPAEAIMTGLPQQALPPVQALPPPAWDHKAPDALYPTPYDDRAPPAQVPNMVPDRGTPQ